ncbi:survival protein sure-like phosphatase/nucleotidase [Melampsora americana]|nr:survival protein sure-like phosphatase/nucleotidase [Melampsora americana]
MDNHRSSTIPTVLLTNDDGPCSSSESPFIHSFSRHLRSTFLGSSPEKLKVVLPDSQKSWIGKAYIIKDTISLNYFDPESSTKSKRPIKNLKSQDQWILLSGTPASCSNIALFNLFPNKIDLVISGPNYGRNTSSAFSLSSGTIGASLDAALSNHKTIALSYGIFERPVSNEIIEAAHQIAVKIIKQLWISGFVQPDQETDHVHLYSVNIPLVPAILTDPQVTWTTEAHTRYGRLFLPSSTAQPTKPVEIDEASASSVTPSSPETPTTVSSDHPTDFVFKPDISALVDPNATHHPIRSDAWALNKGLCTVTPLRAAFAAARQPTTIEEVDKDGVKVWKL